MFIMPWEIFDKYMAWLFDILFELGKRADLSRYDAYQTRLYAFMAERLQTVWFEKHNYKIKELPVLYFKVLKEKAYNETYFEVLAGDSQGQRPGTWQRRV